MNPTKDSIRQDWGDQRNLEEMIGKWWRSPKSRQVAEERTITNVGGQLSVAAFWEAMKMVLMAGAVPLAIVVGSSCATDMLRWVNMQVHGSEFSLDCSKPLGRIWMEIKINDLEDGEFVLPIYSISEIYEEGAAEKEQVYILGIIVTPGRKPEIIASFIEVHPGINK